jgi:hypothetical protein
MDTHYLLVNMDSHYLCPLFVAFLGTFHKSAVRTMERSKPWLYRAAFMSERDKTECTTVSAGVSAAHSCGDGKEIPGGNGFTMIAQEGSPELS